jgi:hypothetical protein
MTAIEQGVYGQLECSKKVFQIVQQLTALAGDVDEKHRDTFRELTEALLIVGKDISDNAAKIGKSLGDIIAKP